jgi:hypothetical protein
LHDPNIVEASLQTQMFFVDRLVLSDLVFVVDATLEKLVLFRAAKEEKAATDYHVLVLEEFAALVCSCSSLVFETLTLDR